MKKALLFCFCLGLLLTTFCAQGEEAVAYVNGEPILRSQVEQRMQNSLFLSAQTSSDMTDQQKEAQRETAKKGALDALVQETALLQAAEKRGIRLENAGVQEDAQQRYQSILSAVESYVHASYPTLAEEALDEQVDELLNLAGDSRESYRQMTERSALLHALDEALKKELPEPSQQDIEARYKQLYKEQKAHFDNDQNAFEAALLQGNIVVYRPVDLKLIQKVEFLFDQEASALIRQTALVSEETAEEMRIDQYRILANEVEEIYRALTQGEITFASVMEEWKEGSSQKVNYFHETSTRFDEAYFSRASAFETVGEISTAYVLPNGYAILHYAGNLEAQEQLPLSQVEEAISQLLLEEGEKEGLAKAKQKIIDSAEVELVQGDSK